MACGADGISAGAKGVAGLDFSPGGIGGFQLHLVGINAALLQILDVLAARRGCYISDLNLAPFLRRMALSDLRRMEENAYPFSQWQEAVRYLTGDERDFASVKEIKAFILSETEAKR